jgi:phenylalanine-4-hydroxylase
VEFDTGLQISGLLTNILINENEPIYLQFSGPCQLAYSEKEIAGQDKLRHPQGFGCPVGKIKSQTTSGNKTKILWESGIALEGELVHTHKEKDQNVLLTFKNCNVTLKEKILFDPSWGEYDLALGEKVVSVFGGAADKEAYGEFEDFSNKRIPEKKYTDLQKELFKTYQKVRDLRISKAKPNAEDLKKILDTLDKKFPNDWLLKLEIYELGFQLKQKPDWMDKIEEELQARAEKNNSVGPFILEGLKLAPQLEI